MNSSDNDNAEEKIDFGSLLARAREARGFTVEDVSAQLKIPAQTIVAIENSDLAALPAATFTQGYLRAYSKFLEISEANVLSSYNRARPESAQVKLKPRSKLPGEASSQSPLVKLVTVLLILAGITIIIFGSYQYYQEKADVMETELESKQPSFTGNSLDLPGLQRDDTGQITTMPEAELDSEQPESIENVLEETESVNESATSYQAPAEEPVIGDVETPAIVENTAAEVEPEENELQDKLEIYAADGSWVEVKDARKKRLFYNMIPVGSSRIIEGKAPFKITMGNASTTSVALNNLEIDLDDVIRANNTAVFSVSSDGGNIIFH